MVEAERAQDVHGVGVAAAGGDDDQDAGGLGGEEGGEVAGADTAVVAEQGAVHVQRNETWGDAADGAGLSGWGQGASILQGRERRLAGGRPALALCSVRRVKNSLCAGPGDRFRLMGRSRVGNTRGYAALAGVGLAFGMLPIRREVFMRCIVHIRKSFDTTGMHFALRLLPLYSADKSNSGSERKVETFTSEGGLSQRLIRMGLPTVYLGRSFSNLREGLDAMWTDIEMAQGVFDGFGKIEDRPPLAA